MSKKPTQKSTLANLSGSLSETLCFMGFLLKAPGFYWGVIPRLCAIIPGCVPGDGQARQKPPGPKSGRQFLFVRSGEQNKFAHLKHVYNGVSLSLRLTAVRAELLNLALYRNFGFGVDS
ncbi:MAG: hypothetical protein K2W95_13295 [Candidatus Obscuribacterales bacterium]|nr:hypothetical protein [Candidatus Obscuribacterales bacterium]